MSLLSAAILLFLVMDPLGNVPLFLSVLAQVDPRRRTRVVVRELVIALVLLSLFLVCGRLVLSALRIGEPAIGISGGVILLLIAVRMIFPQAQAMFGEMPEGEPLVVPLAVPLIAGPSALATALLLVATEPGGLGKWLLALGCAWLASAAILTLSAKLSRLLGRRGLIAVERLMGMVLITIAVQMFLTGVDHFLNG